jgi:hypothetical protein
MHPHNTDKKILTTEALHHNNTTSLPFAPLARISCFSEKKQQNQVKTLAKTHKILRDRQYIRTLKTSPGIS